MKGGLRMPEENKVLSFMDQIEKEQNYKDELDGLHNTPEYKLRKLEQCKDDAKEYCYNNILSKIYKDAIPLNDDYKTAYADSLSDDMKNFIAKRSPYGITYYVKEAIRKGSSFAKKMQEAVENLVDNEYYDKAVNIDDVDPEELIFKSTDDVQKKLDIIGKDLEIDDITNIIHDNVKQSALSEITRAKQEKENIKKLEEELKNDVNMNSKEAVESALEFNGINTKKFYTPTLFKGMMIEKVNEIKANPNFEPFYLYNTMDVFKESPASEESVQAGEEGSNEEVSEKEEQALGTTNEIAFIEAVKEYTALNVVKALKLESFSKMDIDNLAQEYATKSI